MPKIEINKERCKGCKLCIVHCPKACIKLDKALNKKGVYTVVFSEGKEKCTGCTFCALICPDSCIMVYK
ncbi:MAG: 4Fe-4S dicluster domain-containing protein [Candidatus Omnitrophota bacterium]|jgi:2-oxoglutarate ferredoxin oxidoreductase subunit delta|nr:4Fe-4S dicluster domain-containing protein [Candidatus Omnitrophota bacterium]